MNWLTWRLHRSEAAIGILLFAGLLVIMFLAAQSVDAAYDAARGGGCFNGSDDPLCGERLGNYFERVSRWANLTTLLHGVPLVVAALLTIPTLQELERGTHRLAWTQSISRRRWSLSRGGFAAGIAVLVAAAWAAAAVGWRSSVLRDDGGFGRDTFELSPAVLFAYVLFAVTLALAAGVIIRRVIPVLALVAVGFIGTRIGTTFALRPRYRSPIEETVAAASDTGPFTAYEDRWVLDESWLTGTGERIPWERVNTLCSPGVNEQDIEAYYQQCLVSNDLRYFRAYHPTDRVGQFQLIEAAIYLGLAAALFALAYWWLTRRPA